MTRREAALKQFRDMGGILPSDHTTWGEIANYILELAPEDHPAREIIVRIADDIWNG